MKTRLLRTQYLLPAILAGFSIFCLAARFAYSDSSLSVSAWVAWANATPLITSITPSVSPIVISRWSFQTISVQVTDPDSPVILYTLSAASGAIIPANGAIGMTNGKWMVNFTYYAPSSKTRLTPVTLTLNDQSGSGTVNAQIDLYVY